MQETYLQSVRSYVAHLLELIFLFDADEISEMEFYKRWTKAGQVIIDTREENNERDKI